MSNKITKDRKNKNRFKAILLGASLDGRKISHTEADQIIEYIFPEVKRVAKEAKDEWMDETEEKWESEAVIAQKNYTDGYNDALKERKPVPHDTRDGYCCACDYDLAGFYGEVEKMFDKLKKVVNMKTTIFFTKEGYKTIDRDIEIRNQLRKEINERVKKLEKEYKNHENQ